MRRLLILLVVLSTSAADAQIRLRLGAAQETVEEPTPDFVPTGNGTLTTWTANGAATVWEAIDDAVGAPDDATTYASRINSDGDHQVTFATPTVTGTVNSVAVTRRYRNTGSTTYILRSSLRVGGTNYFSSTATIQPGAGFATTTSTWVNNPRTGVAWTLNDVNGIGGNALQQFGVSVTVMASGDAAHLTQLYLTIDHVAGGGGGTPPVAPSGYAPTDNAVDVPVVTTLSCTQQADASAYRIYFGTTSGALNEVTMANPALCSHALSGLANSDEYFWYVCPLNGFGETCGAEQSFTTVAGGAEMDLVAAASACADSADNSPTGRNPRLAWTCAKQETWDQMVVDYLANPSSPATLGGKWFKVIKSYCDAPVYDTPPVAGSIYGDFGQWNALCYQWTGDATYITGAAGMWAKLNRWYIDDRAVPDATTNWVSWDPNTSRIKNGMMTIMLEWGWPALTADQRLTIVQKIDNDNDRGRLVYMAGTFPWHDSDQLMGQGYLPIALMHIILPSNASNEALWNDSEMGGFTATSATPKTTARNTIRFYFEELAAGGEFIEAGEYNPDTIPWTAVMAHAISTAQGSDQFPEITTFLEDYADRYMAGITPDYLKYAQWADEQFPDIWRTFEVANVLTMLSGLLQGTTKGQEAHQLVLDLVTEYGATGAASMAPSIRQWGMYVFNPYVTGIEWRNSKSFYAAGEGAMHLRSGWADTDSLFWNHCAPKYPDATLGHYSVHHQAFYLCDVQLYKNGEWVLHHPYNYAGASTSGEAANVLLTNGHGQAKEYKKVRATSLADTHAYMSATTGGSLLDKNFYQPPPVSLNEHTRDVLHVPGPVSTIVTYDRAHVDVIADTAADLQRYQVGCLSLQRSYITHAHARQEYVIHTPVSPTFSGGAYTWTTPVTSQVVKWTPLLPASQTRTEYDLNTQIIGTARCGWNPSNVLPTYTIDSPAPATDRSMMKVWPSVMGDFHTYLNVFQVGATTPTTPTVITNSDAECAHVVTSGQNDILACFNGTPSAALNDTAYHASHAAALDSVRLRATGFTVAYTASATTTEFYLAHLNPANTWSYTIDGGAPVAIAEDSGGFARIPLSVAAGAHTIVVTGI